jgi:hypothetical protein
VRYGEIDVSWYETNRLMIFVWRYSEMATSKRPQFEIDNDASEEERVVPRPDGLP